MDQQDRRAIARQGEELSKRLWHWDPLTLSPPEDEYDRLTWPLLRMLRNNATAEEITRWLDDQLFRFYEPEPTDLAPTNQPTVTDFVNDTINWFATLETP